MLHLCLCVGVRDQPPHTGEVSRYRLSTFTGFHVMGKKEGLGGPIGSPSPSKPLTDKWEGVSRRKEEEETSVGPMLLIYAVGEWRTRPG